MNFRHSKNRSFDKAFTLIELLAVIAIIGIITGMIVSLAPAVNARKKRDRVEVEKQNLVAMIESYKAKFGHYPPDNANLTSGTQTITPDVYDVLTQVNPLLYELGGGSNNVDKNGKPVQSGSANFLSFDGTSFGQGEIAGAFGMQGILNSDAEMQSVYRAPASGYLNFPAWMVGGKNIDVQGLVVPVSSLQLANNAPLLSKNTPTSTNFWHYDASTTNRHNQASFDVWAVFSLGKTKNVTNGWNLVTNGNWGQ